MSGRSEVCRCKHRSQWTPFLIVLVLRRSPTSSIVKFLGPVMRFSSFMVFLHLIILISLSIRPLCHTVSHAADRSKKTMRVLSRFSKPAFTKEVSAKSWSVVSLPGVKPAYSIGSIWSIIGPIRKRIIHSIILYRQFCSDASVATKIVRWFLRLQHCNYLCMFS